MNVEQFPLILLGILIMMALYAYIGSFMQHKHIYIIHETGIGIIIGFLFGLIMYYASDISKFQFDQQIFFYGLLPPIIFAGGYNLKKKKFFENFTYIMLFGLIATLVCFGITFGLTFLINKLGWILNYKFDQSIVLSTALIVKFSATICASDAVAALTIIKPSKYPKLFSVVFGEGLTNDAIAIILFKVVGGIFDQESEQSTLQILGIIFGKFLLNMFGSLLTGLIIAFLCCKIFQLSRFLITNPITEIIIIYIFGTMSYVIAQLAQLSGVITVLVCGITLAHYNFYNLSVTGQISSGAAFQSVSFASQAFVFIYLGLSTMFYVTKDYLSFTFIFFQLFICVLSRFIAIYGLSILVKLIKKDWNLSFYELLVISIAGTIRGSVAFALILTIDSKQQNRAVNIVKASVLLMVFITTIFLGAAMPSLISCILSSDPSNDTQKSLLNKNQSEQNKQKKKPIVKRWDQQYFKPFFIFDYKNRIQQIKQYKTQLKMNSSQYKGGQFEGMLIAGAKGSFGANDADQIKDNYYTDKQA